MEIEEKAHDVMNLWYPKFFREKSEPPSPSWIDAFMKRQHFVTIPRERSFRECDARKREILVFQNWTRDKNGILRSTYDRRFG
jgi:hypothetical protein